MLAQILKLFALRPLFSMALFGIPILTLVVIGLFAVAMVKFAVFVVLPVGLLVWAVRRWRTARATP